MTQSGTAFPDGTGLNSHQMDFYIAKLRGIERDIRTYFDMKTIQHQMEHLSVEDSEKPSLRNEPPTYPDRPKWTPTHSEAAAERLQDLREVLCQQRAERSRKRRKMV